MAIATTTAASIAAASAAIGIAATAGTTAASFAQARKQRRLQLDAEAKAQEMMSEAQKKLEVNYYDQLAIQKEPYELEREALLSAGAQAIEAGKESERGAAAVAGRVQAAQVAGQREVASAMGQEMLDLEKLSAQEESRLRDIQTQIDIDRARGAQLAAAQAYEAANIANQQGIQGVISLGQQVAAAVPLYSQSGSAKQLGKLEADYGKAIKSGQQLKPEFYGASGQPLPFQEAVGKMGGYGVDVSKVGTMKPMEFMDYMGQQQKGNIKSMREAGFLLPPPPAAPVSKAEVVSLPYSELASKLTAAGINDASLVQEVPQLPIQPVSRREARRVAKDVRDTLSGLPSVEMGYDRAKGLNMITTATPAGSLTPQRELFSVLGEPKNIPTDVSLASSGIPETNIFAATTPSIAATTTPRTKPTFNQWYGMNAGRLQGLSQKALRDMYQFDMSKL